MGWLGKVYAWVRPGRPCPAPQGGGMASCPECEFEIDIDEYDVDKGDTLECDNCGVTLEVVGLSPIELDAVTEDEDEEKDEDRDEDEEEEKEDWDE